MKKLIVAAVASCTLQGPPAQASTSNPIDIHEYLTRFHESPKLVMETPLARRDSDGNIVTDSAPHFEFDLDERSELRKFDEYRRMIRAEICVRGGSCSSTSESPNLAKAEIRRNSSIHPYAESGGLREARDFLYLFYVVTDIGEMEKRNLRQHTLSTRPWSDSYWPTRKGMVARRYADPSYPSGTWIQNFSYFQTWSPAAIFSVGSGAQVASLSPAEKYDYLVGDYGYTLTRANWGKGKAYFDKYGMVPGWVGICHGWAPAAFMSPRPMRSVTVPAFNGGRITFYPSDIKALASLMWARPAEIKFVGGRCNTVKPIEDEVGRVQDDKCFNVNPGTWHIGMVNQMGIAKRSFLMDSTYDHQVWNYPVYAYSYSYFNPQTLAVSDDLAGSIVPKSEFTIDKFSKYRSPAAASVVGVSMDVTYMIPLLPSHSVMTQDQYHTVRYVYDLELDGSGKIIGGEWYSNFRPDFMWAPPPGGRAPAAVEMNLDRPLQWDGESPISSEIRGMARTASGRGEPLAAVVERLLELAK